MCDIPTRYTRVSKRNHQVPKKPYEPTQGARESDTCLIPAHRLGKFEVRYQFTESICQHFCSRATFADHLCHDVLTAIYFFHAQIFDSNPFATGKTFSYFGGLAILIKSAVSRGTLDNQFLI